MLYEIGSFMNKHSKMMMVLKRLKIFITALIKSNVTLKAQD